MPKLFNAYTLSTALPVFSIVHSPFFIRVPLLFTTVLYVDELLVNNPSPSIVNVPLFVNATPFNVTVFPFKLIVAVFSESNVGSSVSVTLFITIIVLPLFTLAIASDNVE